jgi:hypothetical protein
VCWSVNIAENVVNRCSLLVKSHILHLKQNAKHGNNIQYVTNENKTALIIRRRPVTLYCRSSGIMPKEYDDIGYDSIV